MEQSPGTGDNFTGKGDNFTGKGDSPRNPRSDVRLGNAEPTTAPINTRPENETLPSCFEPMITAPMNTPGRNVGQGSGGIDPRRAYFTASTAYPSRFVAPTMVNSASAVVPIRPIARRLGQNRGSPSYLATVARLINPGMGIVPYNRLVSLSNEARPIPRYLGQSSRGTEHRTPYSSTGSPNNNIRPMPVNPGPRNVGRPSVRGSMVDFTASALALPAPMLVPDPTPPQAPELKQQDTDIPPPCFLCKKQFGNIRGLRGHMRFHKDRGWTGVYLPMTFNKKTGKLVRSVQRQQEMLKQVDSALAATIMRLSGETSSSSQRKKRAKTAVDVGSSGALKPIVESSDSSSPPPPPPLWLRPSTPPPPLNNRDDNLFIDLNKSPTPSEE